MTDTQFTFRVDQELKAAFVRKAKDNNRNASLLFRDFMQQYVSTQAEPAKPARPPVAQGANSDAQ